jgi:hypothetical protein
MKTAPLFCLNAVKLAAVSFGMAALLSGCASGPPPRDWQINAFEAQETALDNWLSGNDKLAESEFARARNAVAASARLDLLARLVLARCAAQVASLANLPDAPSQTAVSSGKNTFCSEFGTLTLDAKAPEKAYFEFLSGRWQGLTPDMLPVQHRPLLALGTSTNTAANTAANTTATAAGPAVGNAGTSAADAKLLTAIADPLSRLVASALLLQRGQLSPDGIALAVDTASSQGWRRPLLAWLGVQLQRAQASNNAELAAQVQRRLALAGGKPGAAN